ncbi:MAG: polysaccharide deacetylase family protein, partial [Deltaproteobacteria bacterium]|nr:polysaccharide deacetylase family protein [Deltaproteobacteria bacterium]
MRLAALLALVLAGLAALPSFALPARATEASGQSGTPEKREKSLAELGAELTKTYGGKTPVLWGERLPGIVSRLDAPGDSSENPLDGLHDRRTLALTLDACDGATDTRIIALLRRHGVPAAIFATNRWLRANAKLAAELAEDPLFTFACHGARHKPASVDGKSAYGIAGTKNIAALVEEVEANARALAAATGKRPSWYRSGTAHYDEVALAVIRDLGFAAAGYTVSADAGATLGENDVARRLRAAPDRAIILCHLNRPESGTFAGLARALPAMLKAGAVFVPLGPVPANHHHPRRDGPPART